MLQNGEFIAGQFNGPDARTGLVVDDDRTWGPAASILQRDGYKVLAVNDPTDAILIFEMYESEIEDVVSEELGLTGPELALRLQERTPDLPVVVMNGAERSQGVSRKPFLMPDLWPKVLNALSSGHAH